MGLIPYTNLEDKTSADANKFNSRYGDIIDEINGNLDAANLKNGAVTTAKIQDGAVTSAKLDFSKTVDDNGWTVIDYGTFKEYLLTKAFDVTKVSQEVFGLDSGNLPVGMTANEIIEGQVGVSVYPFSTWADGLSVQAAWFDSSQAKVLSTFKNTSGATLNFKGVVKFRLLK